MSPILITVNLLLVHKSLITIHNYDNVDIESILSDTKKAKKLFGCIIDTGNYCNAEDNQLKGNSVISESNTTGITVLTMYYEY